MNKHWQTLDFFDHKGIVETLLSRLRITGGFIPIEHPTFQLGRVAQLMGGNLHTRRT